MNLQSWSWIIVEATMPEKIPVPSATSLAAFVLLSVLLVSCGGGRDANFPATATHTPAPSPTLKSITLSPANATTEFIWGQQFAATGDYSDGSSKPLTGLAWTVSDSRLAGVRPDGYIQAYNPGKVTVSATSGTITGTATLTIGPEIIYEGQIPVDFNLANAMTSLYGNYDPSLQASFVDSIPGADASSASKGKIDNAQHPFYIASAADYGATKVFLGIYQKDELCHGCGARIGMAVFIRKDNVWVVESSMKTAFSFGTWGQPPEAAHILPISSSRVAVELRTTFTGQGSGITAVSILVPWKGEIREAFQAITYEGNGTGCGDGEDMMPCVESGRDIIFVKGANPDYDDMVVSLSGTELSHERPYRAVKLNATERRIFSEGKYIPAPQ